MEKKNSFKIVVFLLVFVGLVILFSSISVKVWGEKPEKVPLRQELIIQGGMTLLEFGQTNQLPSTLLKEVFSLASKEDLQKRVTEFHLSEDQILTRINKALALEAEHQSKNWFKILLKFALWIVFLGFVFSLVRKGRITSRSRRWVLLSGVILFGIILGSDPSPMGTIKDAIVLLGKSGILFPPRAIALGVFLLLAFLANKFICSWGCQFGTLQDFIFRLNRDSKDRKGLVRQFKPPFIVTNAVRIASFGIFTLVAFLWATDVIGIIDPFKIFSPGNLAAAAGLFIGAVSIASLFVYRPWCHFFCPFGLAGWIVEKVSLFKIKVNYDTCIACEACAKACPSTVMGAILKQERTIPDCFSCATCMETCPTRSISFESGKRNKPPEGKFRQQGNG